MKSAEEGKFNVFVQLLLLLPIKKNSVVLYIQCAPLPAALVKVGVVRQWICHYQKSVEMKFSDVFNE